MLSDGVLAHTIAGPGMEWESQEQRIIPLVPSFVKVRTVMGTLERYANSFAVVAVNFLISCALMNTLT